MLNRAKDKKRNMKLIKIGAAVAASSLALGPLADHLEDKAFKKGKYKTAAALRALTYASYFTFTGSLGVVGDGINNERLRRTPIKKQIERLENRNYNIRNEQQIIKNPKLSDQEIKRLDKLQKKVNNIKTEKEWDRFENSDEGSEYRSYVVRETQSNHLDRLDTESRKNDKLIKRLKNQL